VGTVTVASSISGSYKKLTLEYVIRGTQAADFSYIRILFNNDTTATNYRYAMIYGYGSTSSGAEGGDDSKIGVVAANSSPSNSSGRGKIEVPYYAETTFNKVAYAHGGFRRNTGSEQVMDVNASCEWESTAAITRVDVALVSGNFVSGSTIRLYGET
jgi:hypothetical protein